MAKPGSKGKKTRSKRFPYEPVIFLILIVALIGAGTYLYLGQSSGGDDTWVNDTSDPPVDGIPAFMRIPLQDVDGARFNLSAYKGKVILVDMFATWCDPCMMQLGELQKVRDHYPESELAIITVDVDESESASDVRAIRDDRGLTWRFAMSNPQFSNVFKASSIPTLYYIDETGRIADKAVGSESYSQVRERIEKIKND